MAGHQPSPTGKCADGTIDCCGGSPAGCTVVINGLLADINGVTGPTAKFCPAPPTLYVTVDAGSDTYPIPNQNSGTPTYDSTNGWTFKLQVNMAVGTSHLVHIYSAPDACGVRFDGTITVQCPGPASLTLQASYDLLNTSTTWGVQGCPATGGPVSIDTSVGGASICQSTPTSGPGAQNGLSLVLKVMAWPVSITFTGSAPDCLGASQTLTYTDCNTVSSDWQYGNPFVLHRYWNIIAYGCPSSVSGNFTGFLPLPDATVTASGSFVGSGTTTGAFSGDIMEITSWTPPKLAPWKVYWAVSHERFVGVTYDSDAINQSNQGSGLNGGGTYCPMGGGAGNLASGYACGGCPTPFKTTLFDSVLGTTVTLTYQGSRGWVGLGSFVTLSENCDQAPIATSSQGAVTFQVGFGQLNVNSDGSISPAANNGPLCLYACNAQGFISQCPFIESNSRQLGCQFGISQGGPYSSSEQVNCNPLLLEISGTTSACCRDGIDPHDGHSIVDCYPIEISHSITE